MIIRGGKSVAASFVCVGHDTNLTGSIPVAGIYRQAKRMASC